MLLNPVAGQEQMFRIEWNRPYEVRPSVLNIYIMGDPSKGKNKTSDRTAIAVVGIDQHNNKYLLDGYCHRMPQSERWKCLKSLYVKWSAMPGVQSITVGWETYGLQTDHEYFIERMREEKDAPVFTVAELNWVREGQQSKPRASSGSSRSFAAAGSICRGSSGIRKSGRGRLPASGQALHLEGRR
jgi:hypothetical protein